MGTQRALLLLSGIAAEPAYRGCGSMFRAEKQNKTKQNSLLFFLRRVIKAGVVCFACVNMFSSEILHQHFSSTQLPAGREWIQWLEGNLWEKVTLISVQHSIYSYNLVRDSRISRFGWVSYSKERSVSMDHHPDNSESRKRLSMATGWGGGGPIPALPVFTCEFDRHVLGTCWVPDSEQLLKAQMETQE